MGPRMAPSQYHSLVEWPRRPAIQPESNVNTASRRSATAKPIMGFPVEDCSPDHRKEPAPTHRPRPTPDVPGGLAIAD